MQDHDSGKDALYSNLVSTSNRFTAKRVLIGGMPFASGELSRILGKYGFIVESVELISGIEDRILNSSVGIVVINLSDAEPRGLGIVRWLATWERPPYLLVRCDTEDELDRIIAMDMGADDSVSSRCSVQELCARVRSLERRRIMPNQNSFDQVNITSRSQVVRQYKFAEWTLDVFLRSLITPTGKNVIITDLEYRILTNMLSDSDAENYRSILRINGENKNEVGGKRSLDVGVSRLRKKLNQYDGRDIIGTVYGKGYRITHPVEFIY